MIYILWDASDIWGPLAAWGIKGLGAPCAIIRAADVARGVLQHAPPSIVLVPGGFSRHKSSALGDAGCNAIRNFVRDGGAYIGFCGGAGLALSEDHALGICPWRRAGYTNRIQHYMSGHFYTRAAPHARLRPNNAPTQLLPVWWPGRFAPGADSADVTVLASYDAPGPDFWLADLPASVLPPAVFEHWEKKYGFSPSPSFLQNEACMIHGQYGKGEYVLTYTHLETPESPEANAWLAHLLQTLGNDKAARSLVPGWNLETLDPLWDDPALMSMWSALSNVLDTGVAAGLFFARSPWLMGWRTGLPGAALNTARAELHTALSLPPSLAAESFWKDNKTALIPVFNAFAEQATSYLLAERLAMTLAKELPDGLCPENLIRERIAVFGASGMAAHAGGLLGQILPILSELALLQLQNRDTQQLSRPRSIQ